MRTFKTALCIAGTHGKTSTTSMISIAAVDAGLDPTIMLGGDLSYIGGSLRIGGNELIIAESCEYMNSFLSFAPTIPVILNIDRDHLDFFHGDDEISASFREFAEIPEAPGMVIYNSDDINTLRCLKDIDGISFGAGDDARMQAVDITMENGLYCCNAVFDGEHYCNIRMNVPGRYNLQNALAAAACAAVIGIPGASFAKSIERYQGVGRRFEYRGDFCGARVFDDYAHHPNEITAALSTAKDMTDGKVFCVFQPHTYTRTKELMDDFAQSLSLADSVILCPVFAAREEPISGVSSEILAQMIPGAQYADDFASARYLLKDAVNNGDIILTMGAGDIFKLANLLSEGK